MTTTSPPPGTAPHALAHLLDANPAPDDFERSIAECESKGQLTPSIAADLRAELADYAAAAGALRDDLSVGVFLAITKKRDDS